MESYQNKKNGLQETKTPLRAIHQFCVECVGGQVYDVKDCGGDHSLNGGCDRNGVCYFYKYRMGKGRPSVKTIRMICLWCQGRIFEGIKDCYARDCALYPYRFGKNPARKGKGGFAHVQKNS